MNSTFTRTARRSGRAVVLLCAGLMLVAALAVAALTVFFVLERKASAGRERARLERGDSSRRGRQERLDWAPDEIKKLSRRGDREPRGPLGDETAAKRVLSAAQWLRALEELAVEDAARRQEASRLLARTANLRELSSDPQLERCAEIEVLMDEDFEKGTGGWRQDRKLGSSHRGPRIVLGCHKDGGYLRVVRTGSRGRDGHAKISRTLEAEVDSSDLLLVAARLCVISHTLGDVKRYTDRQSHLGGYPLEIRLDCRDATGQSFAWTQGFVVFYYGATRPENVTAVSVGDWHWYGAVTHPAAARPGTQGREASRVPYSVKGITIGGSGWDFRAAVDELRLVKIKLRDEELRRRIVQIAEKTGLPKEIEEAPEPSPRIGEDRGKATEKRKRRPEDELRWWTTSGNLERMRNVLDTGLHPDTRNRSGRTALIEAARKGQLEAASLLLQYGAGVDAWDMRLETPLSIAASGSRIDLVELLIHRGADVNVMNEHGNTPLMNASARDIALLLIDRGAEIESRNENGWTPLLCAALRGRPEVMECLLTHGAAVDARDRSGTTALMMVAQKAPAGCTELLIEHGGDVNARRRDGETALMRAASAGRTDVAQSLLEHGADPNARDRFGKTALTRARETHKKKEMVALLKKYGARQ